MENIDFNIQIDGLNSGSKKLQEIIKELSSRQRDEMLKLLIEEQKQTICENLRDINIRGLSEKKKDIAIELILHNLENNLACLSAEEQKIRKEIRNYGDCTHNMNPYEVCRLLMRFIQFNLDKIGYESGVISGGLNCESDKIKELVHSLSDDEKNKIIRFLAGENKKNYEDYEEIYMKNYYRNVEVADNLLLENMKKNYVTVEEDAEVLGVRGRKIHVNLPAVGKFKGFKFDYFVGNEEIIYCTFLNSPELIKKSFSYEEIEKLRMAISEYFGEFGINREIGTYMGYSYHSDFILRLLNFDHHFCLSDSYKGPYGTLYYILSGFGCHKFYNENVGLLLKISK